MIASYDWRGKADASQSIERRILDALIWIVHVRKWKPKAIYLIEEDLMLLPPENRFTMDVAGIPVRISKAKFSVFYATCWRGKRI